MNLKALLKLFSLGTLLQVAMETAGQALTAKDVDNTGLDDATGRVLINLAPAMPALVEGGSTVQLKSLKLARTALDEVIHQIEGTPSP